MTCFCVQGLGWKQRYFTQIGDSLFYYSQSGLTALGRIDLTDVSWIYFPRPNPRLKFKLHTLADDRVWTLRCESESELEMWKAGVLKYCQNGPPVDSKLARESKVSKKKTDFLCFAEGSVSGLG
jgi:hypothetical protein